ncbi:MAG: hypothetical protein JKY54_05875 [Flavobacteriales bacterium]|nr:hypothetical protein [Flavobacteriales bacterium]
MAKYNNLFSIHTEHDYYTDKISNDVTVFPTIETAEKFSHYRLLYRNEPSSSSLIFTEQAGSNFTAKYTFGLRANVTSRKAFLNITDFDDNVANPVVPYTSGKIIYFTNQGLGAPDVDLKYSLLDGLKAPLFTYDLPVSNPATVVSLEIKDADDITVSFPNESEYDSNGNPLIITSASPIEKADGTYSYKMDFRKLPEGLYTFKSTYTEAAVVKTIEEKIYIHAALSREGVLGIVDIDYTAAVLDKQYKIKFKSKNVKWKYTVINKNEKLILPAEFVDTDTNKVFVTDPALTSSTLSGTHPSSFVGYPTSSVLEFTSTAVVQLKQIPITGIKLTKEVGTTTSSVFTSASSTDILLSLPNPTATQEFENESPQICEMVIYI